MPTAAELVFRCPECGQQRNQPHTPEDPAWASCRFHAPAELISPRLSAKSRAALQSAGHADGEPRTEHELWRWLCDRDETAWSGKNLHAVLGRLTSLGLLERAGRPRSYRYRITPAGRAALTGVLA